MVTAMVTPFKEDLSVDFPRAQELARRLVEHGNESLVVAGTTGESPTLSKDEKNQLFKAVKEGVPAGVKIIAGTGSNDTRATIEASKAAADTGADALLVVAPYYNKPAQDMLRRHFLEIAEAVSLPIMVYNIPGRTGVEIGPDILAKLAEHPRILAVKESLPDVDNVTDLAARVRSQGSELWIYSGDDSHTLSIMSAGGCGVVSVAGHLVGKEMAEMMKLYEEGKVREATAIHLRIFPLIKGLFATTNPVLVKAGLKLVGFPVGGLRPPVYAATAEEEARLLPLLGELSLTAR